MSRPIEPFPLHWPDGWPRTAARDRKRWPHHAPLGWALVKLKDEVRRIDGLDLVVTSDLPVRRDGMPYADGRATDPGIAIYWRQQAKDGKGYDERAMACDRWLEPGGNVRALSMTISALRGMIRWGSTSLVERAFSGFAALPHHVEADWRIELGVTAAADLATARSRYLALSRERHPDHGGDLELMARLNQAWAAAQRELGG